MLPEMEQAGADRRESDRGGRGRHGSVARPLRVSACYFTSPMRSASLRLSLVMAIGVSR